jgi:hypothetical protein
MANLLRVSTAFTPAIAVMTGMLALGLIPVQEVGVSTSSVNVQVTHYESSASGGILHL